MSRQRVTEKLTKQAVAKYLGIYRTSFYYQYRQFIKDWQLKVKIEETLHLNPSYGHKRLASHLNLNKKRILRVMKIFGIKPYRRRSKKPWKKPGKPTLIYPNLLLKTLPSRANQIWASDFTYLKFKGRFVYLATVIDIFTREVIGFSVSTGHGVSLVVNALLSALNLKAPPEILHSDQGREYTSRTYTSLVESLGINGSMSRKASPWENGYQEAFYSQFKVDLGDPNRFDDLGELVAEIYQAIHIYNTRRIHTVLKMPPRHYAMLKSLTNQAA